MQIESQSALNLFYQKVLDWEIGLDTIVFSGSVLYNDIKDNNVVMIENLLQRGASLQARTGSGETYTINCSCREIEHKSDKIIIGKD